MKLLAQSQHYTVTAEYEVVWLMRSHNDPVVIGDFYGDPTATVIDWQQRWCVMTGAGLIVYSLRDPFQPYSYATPSTQWYEMFRPSATPTLWIEAVYQVADDTVRFVVDPATAQAGVYDLDIATHHVKRVIPHEANT